MGYEVGQDAQVMHCGKMTRVRIVAKRLRSERGRPGTPAKGADGEFVSEYCLSIVANGRAVCRIPAYRTADKIFPV